MKKVIIIFVVVLALVLVAFFILDKDESCQKEGEWGIEGCCVGLVEAPCMEMIDGDCIEADCGHICIECGNGECGLGENYCNCSQDCSE
jgi:hypothetical protein